MNNLDKPILEITTKLLTNDPAVPPDVSVIETRQKFFLLLPSLRVTIFPFPFLSFIARFFLN